MTGRDAEKILIGEKVFYFTELESTNTFASNAALEIYPYGTVIVADFQTAGRGQYGRNWLSSPGDSLLMSIIFKAKEELKRPAVLTALVAVSVATVLEKHCKQFVQLKWPNDLKINHKKISGILIEQHQDRIVIGLGLNLNQQESFFIDQHLHEATSLRIESGKAHSRESILDEISSEMNFRINQIDNDTSQESIQNSLQPLEDRWKEMIGLAGYPVRVQQHDGQTMTGALVDIGFDGAVLLNDQGQIHLEPLEMIKQLLRLH